MSRRTGNPEVTRLVVGFLLHYSGGTQAAFGKEARVDQSEISRYLAGKKAPPEESLRRMAAAAGLVWPVVIQLQRIFEAVIATAEGRAASEDLSAGDPPFLSPQMLDRALLAVGPFLVKAGAGHLPQPAEQEVLREADAVWQALAPFSLPERQRLLGSSLRPARDRALAARLGAANPPAHLREETL